MTLRALREAAEPKIVEGLVPAVLERLAESHKKHWRDCPCSWCATKREATSRIANHVCGNRTEREMQRAMLRQRYRAKLKEEFER